VKEVQGVRKDPFFYLNRVLSLIIPMGKPKNKKGKSANAKQNSGNATAKKAKNGGKKK